MVLIQFGKRKAFTWDEFLDMYVYEVDDWKQDLNDELQREKDAYDEATKQ